MNRSICLFAALFLMLLDLARAGTGFVNSGITLYQPNNVLQDRVTSVADLGDYIKRLQQICSDFFPESAAPESLQIVVALKPGKRSRVWLVSSTRPGAKELEVLRAKLEAAPAADVLGVAAFGIAAKIAGGDPHPTGKFADSRPPGPLPKEWTEAIEKVKEPKAPFPDEIIAQIWPDPPGAPGARAQIVPEGFVLQVLEPTGGKIVRPKDWFYAENRTPHYYLWTLSREDSREGRYITGVRIQLLTGIKEGTGKTGKEFVADFIESKKKAANKVVSTCDEENQGMFSRVCLEVEEGNDRIQYSLFWGNNDLDLVVVSISGTTKDLWDTYSPIFERMRNFELIDMKRFQDREAKPAAK